MIFLTIWEYIVGFILEKIFKTKYWDYSNIKFNINGRVCLKNSIYWGILGVIFIFIIHPVIGNLVNILPASVIFHLNVVLYIILITDMIITVNRILFIDDKIEEVYQIGEKIKEKISELKTANNELQKDIEKKIQIDEMRKEFLSNVSHELKTPIALIQGYAEGLYDNINDDSESREFYCEVIMDEADKMNKMVKKLLTLNQIEFGNNQVNFEHFDIVQVVRTVINSATLLAKQKEAQIEIDDYPQIYVWADEYMIEEVVTNYVSNAINHVDGEKKIKVSLKKTDKVVRVSVFNTGKCIPEEELDKIWIKFYKVDKARTREYGGSGIGLSIVKAIMESMNQKCGVLNHEDGVEFWFELDIEKHNLLTGYALKAFALYGEEKYSDAEICIRKAEKLDSGDFAVYAYKQITE